jgi:lipopolysaccharide transport system permease protein
VTSQTVAEDREILYTEIAPSGYRGQYWRDLWHYRELFYFLAWRDILVRYRQTVAGVAWAWIRPAATMIVATTIFGHIARLPSADAPYPVMVFAGLLPWQLFANALSDSGGSLIGNANLIAKVYFPRLVIPASSVIVGLVDFLIAGVLFLALMVWYDVPPTWRIVMLPWFILLALAAALGAGLWLAAVTVKYRDFRFVAPFLVQFGFFMTPVAYPSSAVPPEWRLMHAVNPLVGIVDGFRWALLGGTKSLYFPAQVAAAVGVAAVLISGFLYFRRTERSFADVI